MGRQVDFVLPQGGRYDVATKTLHGAARDDVFEACVGAMHDLVLLQRRLPLTSVQLVLARCDLFESTHGSTITDVGQADFHGDYRLLDFRLAGAMLAAHFPADQAVCDLEAQLLARYRVEVPRTLAVVYPASGGDPQVYLDLARHLLVRYPGFRVWIHAEQADVRRIFCRAFGERCFFVHELVAKIGLDAAGDALRLAVVRLLARCAVVVVHRSPLALWLMLTRGHSQGVWHFDTAGTLFGPTRWARYWPSAKRLINRAAMMFRRPAA